MGVSFWKGKLRAGGCDADSAAAEEVPNAGQNFQFLNLSKPGSNHAALPRPSERKNKNSEVASCATFTILNNLDDTDHQVESQVRDLFICNKIVEALRAEGIKLNTASRFKPWGAGTRIDLSGFEVTLWLTAKRRHRYVNCYLSTYTRPNDPWLYFTEDWARARALMEKVIREDLKADAVHWITEEQLDQEEAEAEESASPNYRS